MCHVRGLLHTHPFSILQSRVQVSFLFQGAIFLAKLRNNHRQDWEIWKEEERARCWRAGQGEHFRGGGHGMEGTKQGFGAWKAKDCSEAEREKRSSAGSSCSLKEAACPALYSLPSSSGKPGTARAVEKIKLLYLLMN